MSNDDLITLPKFLAKMPTLISSLPAMVKGSVIANNTDQTKPLGMGLRFQETTRMNPNGLAVAYQDMQLSYAQLNAWANRLADFLLSTGIQKGDAVVVNIENRPEFLAATLACGKIGAVAALINTSQRGKVLTHSFNLVKPKAAIIGEELVDAVEEVRSNLELSDDAYYFFADTNTLEDSGTTPEGYKNLADLIKDCSSENPDTAGRIYMKDPLFYIYTSGTTGLPKAVVFNHGRWEKAYGGFGFGAVRMNKHDRIYCSLPFYHATGLCVCWGSAIAAQSGLVLARKFSASRFWDEIRKYECTAFGYVGELCRYLMECPEQPNDLDNKVHVIVGNGMRPSIWGKFKKRFGIDRVVELYASSEGNIGFSNFLNFDNTVGFSPVPYAIVKYDKENEAPIRDKNGFMIKAAKGEPGLMIGEITDKTPFDGYTDKEKTEGAIFRDVFKKGDAYFNTGDMMRDIGFRHAQFVDRLGDTFRWKGENVSTTEVEQILDGFDGIHESVVYGVEIPNTNGRAGMACIRLDKPHDEFDWAGLVAYARKELPPYAVPLFLRINEKEMETTGTFKHQKNNLKNQAYDLSKQDNPVYVLLPGSDAYEVLTPEIQKGVDEGEYRM